MGGGATGGVGGGRAFRGSALKRSPRGVHLGSWSVFCDIAGQVSQSPANPVVTVAAVGIAAEVVHDARRRLLRRFDGRTVKWKSGAAAGFAQIAALATTLRTPICIYQVHSDGTRWAEFYRQALSFHQEAKEKTGKPLAFLDGDEVMRMSLFGEVFAELVGRLLRARQPWPDVPATIDLQLIVDTDLRSAETREHFKWALLEWARTSRVRTELGVSLNMAGRVETEQAEPLLLLPDYVAGVYQHADPRTRLGDPVVTPEEATALVHDLRRRLGDLLFEIPLEFQQEYPLEHREGKVVERRDV